MVRFLRFGFAGRAMNYTLVVYWLQVVAICARFARLVPKWQQLDLKKLFFECLRTVTGVV